MSHEVQLLLALDLTGTFAFALNGAMTALRVARLDLFGVVTLGMITALGGGIIRDVLVTQVPTVLQTGLYAVPAAVAAMVAVVAIRTDVYGVGAASAAAACCFAIRMLGVRYGLNVPGPPGLAQVAVRVPAGTQPNGR